MQMTVVATQGIFALMSYNYKPTEPAEVAARKRVIAVTPRLGDTDQH
jgi:hypothetical protein